MGSHHCSWRIAFKKLSLHVDSRNDQHRRDIYSTCTHALQILMYQLVSEILAQSLLKYDHVLYFVNIIDSWKKKLVFSLKGLKNIKKCCDNYFVETPRSCSRGGYRQYKPSKRRDRKCHTASWYAGLLRLLDIKPNSHTFHIPNILD